jgi:replication factor C subunit 3/5
MTVESKTSVPWVEKYRPSKFDDIVLDDVNRKIFENIIKKEHFPNLLFYGPPGTGKTTTIINLIKAYQEKVNNIDSKLMIHLNASDDRGIDIIRSQISQFVNSKTLFNNGLKFVILDEADYMTKNAQQALHNLIENMNSSIRICLICNYLSKIDMSLQGEFVQIRFNKLPEKDFVKYL